MTHLHAHERFEEELVAEREHRHPFVEPEVFVEFSGPEGRRARLRAFHDGGRVWRWRFAPPVAGLWTWRVTNTVRDPGLEGQGTLEVALARTRGMLRVDKARVHGLAFDDGSEPLILGDTIYNLLGAAHSGMDWEGVVRRRREQGFNVLRVRLTPSAYHPNTPYSEWMGKAPWFWGGGPQCPEYDRFNTGYAATVDRVLARLEELEMGVELILESWLMESPFNDRGRFHPEHEELFLEYAVARWGGYRSVWFWDVANEYNLHVPPAPYDHPLGTRYARRLGRLIRSADVHGHPVAAHVTAAERLVPPFQERFRGAREIDVLLLQNWGDCSTERSIALATGIEEEIARSAAGAEQPVIFAEYGYERAASASNTGWFGRFGPSHTRRGALRALFSGLPVMAGFDNTWGPFFTLDGDARGADQVKHLRRLFTEWTDFRKLRPAGARLVDPGSESAKPPGERTLVLSDAPDAVVLAWLPVGGTVVLCLTAAAAVPGKTVWFCPSTGETHAAFAAIGDDGRLRFTAPAGKQDEAGLPLDWILWVMVVRG